MSPDQNFNAQMPVEEPNINIPAGSEESAGPLSRDEVEELNKLQFGEERSAYKETDAELAARKRQKELQGRLTAFGSFDKPKL